jgi:hypothetical protein
MAGVFNPYASGSEWKAPASGWRAAPKRPWLRLVLAVGPWVIASGIATVTMNAQLSPRADETDLPQPETPPPPPAQPGHSDQDDVYFDPLELLAV